MIFFDVETQSACDLRRVGGRRYAAHPSTRLLSLVALVDDVVVVWVPGREVPEHWGDLWPDDWDRRALYVYNDDTNPLADSDVWRDVWVAHNCDDFDSHILRRYTPRPHRWYDTIHAARAAGLPGSLDEIGERLGVGRKMNAKDLLRRATTAIHVAEYSELSATRRRRYEIVGAYAYPVILPGDLRVLLAYNIADVLLLERVYHATKGHGEPNVIEAHRDVNARGVAVDLDLVHRVVEMSKESAARAGDEIERITGNTLRKGDLRSVPKVKKWLDTHYVTLPDLRKETVARFLNDPLEWTFDEVAVPRVVLDVLRLRQSALKITTSKLETLIDTVDADERLRDTSIYYGAHTGRWTSRRVQLHNMTRGVKIDVDKATELTTYDEFANYAAACDATVDDVLSSLIRPCFVAADGKRLLLADYNAIEARGLAWVAGEQSLLDTFTNDGDPYCEFASRLFGREITKADVVERQIGKVCVLGCGYGMSGKKLGTYAAMSGVDLAAVGLTGDDCVEAYRSTYRRIAGYKSGSSDGRIWRRDGVWHGYDAAAKSALEGDPSTAGRCHFERRDGGLQVTLPSGRILTYQNCRVEDRVPAYATLYGLDASSRPQIVYDSPRGERTLYGGKITENIVQAICRDLLADAMVRCELAGLPAVLHVHDELVVESESSRLGEFASLMSEPPDWAVGFPIKVEAFDSSRYVKAPGRDSNVVVAVNGKVR